MGEFIRFGSLLGLGLGALHFLYILYAGSAQSGGLSLKSLWHGLGVWILWVMFGAYVLAFWVIGWVLLLAGGLLPSRGRAR